MHLIYTNHMSGSQIEEIKSRISIEEVVGEHVELALAGKNIKGLCPFHNEKTPSFVVSPDRGTYYCFGCGAKGDIFSFLQEYQGMDFKEALKTLADRAGVVLDSYSEENKSETDLRIKILEKAADFFESQLVDSSEAKDYVISRGISSETRKNFRIGYAPNEWHLLHNFLEKSGFKIEDIVEVGLAKKGDKGYYDHFRDRIMFPIMDVRGRVIAFTGRLLHKDDKSAKYVNSPESPVFHKSEVLFGLNFAKAGIRKVGEIVLVEGQVDLIMAHQAGTLNAVATSGTAFTEDHAEILFKYANKIVIAYDGDMAGQKAASRAWNILLEKGFSIKVASMPGGEDPADIINRSKSEWSNIISSAKTLIEFMTNKIYEFVSDPHKRIKLVEEKVLPKLKYIQSNIEKSYFIGFLAQRTGIKEEILWHHTRSEKKEAPKKESVDIKAFPLEKEIRSIVAWQESTKIEDRMLDPEDLKAKLREIHNLCDEPFDDDMKISEEDMFIFEEKFQKKEELEQHFKEVFKGYSREMIKNAISHLSDQLGGESGDSEEILTKIHTLTQKSKEISG